MRNPRSSTELLKIIGEPKEVARELESFRKTAKVFSSNAPRLLDKHSKRWVAVYRGEVRAQAAGLSTLLRRIDDAGLPRSHVLVRFIEKNKRTFIL